MNLPQPAAVSRFKRRTAVALSAGSFWYLGACLTLPGTLLPVLLTQFHMTLVQAGSMLALQPVGYLIAVLAAGHLIKRHGSRSVLSAGMLAAASGYAGFAAARGWGTGAAMLCVTGLGFGLLEVAANTLLIRIGGARSSNVLNFAHLFFGVGSFVTPAPVARAVTGGVSWRWVFAVAAVAAVGMSIAWRALVLDDTAAAASTAASRSTRLPRGVLLCAVMLAVYVGVETGIGAWLTKYMVSVRAMTLSAAANTLSLYWLGLAGGRLILSLHAHRWREPTLLLSLSGAATLAIAWALLSGGPWMAAAGFFGTGLGFSGIFPAVVALGGRQYPEDTAAATSVMIAGAGIGGIIVPWAMSVIAATAGLVAGMIFYASLCAVLVGLAGRMSWRPRVAG